MNEKEILKMMDHINDEYLTEASETPKTNIKLKKRIISFAAAAAIATTLSVGAFAAYKALNRESVGTYYDSSAMDKIEQSGYVSDVNAKNEHFDISLDTLLKDDYSIKAVVSVKALDEAAQKFLGTTNALVGEMVYADTGEKIPGYASIFGMNDYEKDKAYPMRLTVSAKNSEAKVDLSRPIKINFVNNQHEPELKDLDLFDDLTLELKDVKQSKSAKFTSPSGAALNVSEFTISYDVITGNEDAADKLKEQDKSADSFVNMDDVSNDLKIYYKDGTVTTLEDKLNNVSFDLVNPSKYVMIIDLKTFVDPDAIDHIECKGVTYTR